MARGLSRARRARDDCRRRSNPLIENDPRARGLNPDGNIGIKASRPGPASAPAAGLSIAEAVKSKRFLGLYAACLFCAFGVFVPFVHLTPYAIDHGMAKSSAVILVSVIGVGSTVGRFFLGGLADRLGRRLSLLAMFVGMAASLLIWAVSTTFWPLAAFAFVFDVAYGGWVALLPSVVMDYFGGRNVSGIIGVLHQRRHRHACRPERRGLRLRRQPQLYGADPGQRRRQRDRRAHHGCNV